MNNQQNTPVVPFFVNAAAMGSLTVKSHVKAGRRPEQNDK